MAAVIPLLGGKQAVKGTESAQAIKNDLYVRRWQSKTGKGKNAKIVDHELHFNAVGLALGAAGTVVAGGLAVLGGALALRFSGKKLELGEATKYFMIDDFEASSHLETVVITPATDGYWTNVKYTKVWVPGAPAVTEERRVYDSEMLSVLMTKRGVPIGVFKGPGGRIDAVNRATKRTPKTIPGTVESVRNQRIMALNPVTQKQEYAERWYYKYKVKGISLTDKEDESWISKVFGV